MDIRKEIARFVKLAEDQNWEVRRTKGNHLMFTPPGDRPHVLVAGTPSDHRAIMNVRSLLRRSGLQGV